MADDYTLPPEIADDDLREGVTREDAEQFINGLNSLIETVMGDSR